MTSYEEEDQYPGGEDYGSLPKFQQFEGPGSTPAYCIVQYYIMANDLSKSSLVPEYPDCFYIYVGNK